jgi:DNA-binding NarL/FixJ family response regulator
MQAKPITEITVLVVDDQRVLAEALAIAIGQEQGLRAEAATSAEAAVEAARILAPDVVLIDLELPGIGGLAAIRRIRTAHPSTGVIVISAHDEDLTRARAVEAGAVGFLTKLSAMADLSRAVRLVHDGESLMEPDEIARLERMLRHRRHQENTERMRIGRLTPRQLEILQLVAEGMATRAIAQQLRMSPLTLRTHIQNVLTRLSVHTKLEAVALAIRHGKVSVASTAGRTVVELDA